MSPFSAAFPMYPSIFLGLLSVDETLLANLDTTFITGCDFHLPLSQNTGQLPIQTPCHLI